MPTPRRAAAAAVRRVTATVAPIEHELAWQRFVSKAARLPQPLTTDAHGLLAVEYRRDAEVAELKDRARRERRKSSWLFAGMFAGLVAGTPTVLFGLETLIATGNAVGAVWPLDGLGLLAAGGLSARRSHAADREADRLWDEAESVSYYDLSWVGVQLLARAYADCARVWEVPGAPDDTRDRLTEALREFVGDLLYRDTLQRLVHEQGHVDAHGRTQNLYYGSRAAASQHRELLAVQARCLETVQLFGDTAAEVVLAAHADTAVCPQPSGRVRASLQSIHAEMLTRRAVLAQMANPTVVAELEPLVHPVGRSTTSRGAL